jgi:hypothetical protein
MSTVVTNYQGTLAATSGETRSVYHVRDQARVGSAPEDEEGIVIVRVAFSGLAAPRVGVNRDPSFAAYAKTSAGYPRAMPGI